MKNLFLLLISFLAFFITNAQQPFITTWEMTSINSAIRIPTDTDNHNYNYTIDFGDGTVLTNQTGDIFYSYGSSGIYTVSISGIFPYFNGFELSSTYENKLLSIEQWGDIQWLSMKSAFHGCNQLVLNATDAPDLSQVTDLSYMFQHNANMNSSINHWNVSNIINMQWMFVGAQSFDQPLDNWDVSNVTNMASMFSSASSFNQPLNMWDVSNVTDMTRMFGSAINFNQPLNMWDVSNVTDMTRMFNNAFAFNQPLNNWDISNLTTMEGMFWRATSFNQPLQTWDLSSINSFGISMRRVFKECSAFDQDLSNWVFTNTNLIEFLDDSGMSPTNYDLLLNKLAFQNLANGTLHALSLMYCDADTRQELLDAGWIIWDANQTTDCNYNIVTGKVLYDVNDNGCDANDLNVSNYFIDVFDGSDNSSYGINTNGEYFIGLSSGFYTLSILNLSSNLSSTPISQTINFTGQNELLEDIDFCIASNQDFEDLSIDIFPLDDAIPGFETVYQIVISNNGTQSASNVQATFEYDGNFQSFVSSTTPPNSNIGNMLTYNFSSINPLSVEIIEVTLINAIPPTLNGGEVLVLDLQVTPDTNDVNIKDNLLEFEQTVVNSYDPNDKMVVQGAQLDDDDIDQYLDYRIRFQNLGTANALNVKITDTIDNNLDWSTFQPITSSHDYRIEIMDGEQINYYFDNIDLPFETADPAGSNGYITYKIKPKPTVQIGDTFENTAYIYFDFNLPIITNTAYTTVVDKLSTEAFDLSRIKMYPNPVADMLYLEVPNTLKVNSIQLFDISGKLIIAFENHKTLDVNGINQGMYILRIETDKGEFNQKVIKR
jgi:uncharacterized repeat protein (TIGR01451 family)